MGKAKKTTNKLSLSQRMGSQNTPRQDDTSKSSTSSSSQTKRRGGAVKQAEDLEKFSNEVVVYLLVNEVRKIPTKKADIVKHVFKTHGGKQFKEVMDLAKKTLLHVYGVDVVELDEKSSTYILINKMPAFFEELPKPDAIKRNLLHIVLGLLYMKGDRLHEVEVLTFLETLPIGNNLIVDIKKWVTNDLVRQCYLKRIDQLDSDPPVHIISWGRRAHLEVDKEKIGQMLCKVMGKRPEDYALFRRAGRNNAGTNDIDMAIASRVRATDDTSAGDFADSNGFFKYM